MKTILHVVDVAGTRPAVYEALATEKGLAGWWSTEVTLSDAKVGAVIDFTFLEGFNPDMEIIDLEPDSKIAWSCVGGHEPWAGSSFHFEMGDLDDDKTRLRFRMDYGIELDDDAYGIYNFNWGYYLESLRLLVVEGTGKPFDPSSIRS